MNQLTLFAVGVVLGVIAPLVAVIAVRKRTGSETDHNEASAADAISQGAARLIPYYESRISTLEKGLAIAQEAEQRCLARLDAMQAQINTLLATIANPPTTTTVTTAVTTHDTPTPPEGETPT